MVTKGKILMKKIITSESVNIGHPDKTCDTIADAFLDEALRQDKNSMMAVECAIAQDLFMIYGEMTSTANIDFIAIAEDRLKKIGYTNNFRFVVQVGKQSTEINKAVTGGSELTANDQGMMYGYATNETPEFMPMPIVIAHMLMREYEKFRQTSKDFFSDAKSQVSVEYDDNVPVAIRTILVSASHRHGLTHEYIEKQIKLNVINKVLKKYEKLVFPKTSFVINPSGAFSIWGSFSDSGCVGRKIVVDTYGGVGRVGGGCFSSKNATKVDRSGAYYARYVAKNVVANSMADKCEVGISYAIGIAKPVSINIDCFDTNKVPMLQIQQYVDKNFDFRPTNIIKELDLLKPIYESTACYGHFGREEFSWEKIKK
ncbi:s-adenosylmethionine synthetase [Holotrichia oblita]|nr:s-adenosylmethionine synthetase [Holotrichia oblita]